MKLPRADRSPRFVLKVALACAFELLRVTALFRYLNRRKVKILLYHGVVEAPLPGVLNSQDLHIPVKQFARQIAYLARHHHILSLEEFLQKAASGAPFPPYAVVLTFDDGYRNTYRNALPVLQRYNTPATFFVTTSFVSSTHLLWLDQLEFTISATQAQQLTLPWPDGTRVWALGSSRARRQALAEIKQHLKRLPEAARQALLVRITQQLGTHQPAADYYCAPLSWDEMSAMAFNGVARIGSHAVTHVNLDTLEESRVRTELAESRRTLEERLGKPVETFAYPGGGYTTRIQQLLREHGYRCGLTTEHGFNTHATDPFALRRNEIGNRGNFLLFKATVSGVLDALKGRP